MLDNRFEKCKFLEDLYNVFSSEEGVDNFNNLSDEELERVAVVFEANLPKAAVLPVIPLNEAGYVYIWNVVIEEVETAPIPDEEDEANDNDMASEETIKNNMEDEEMYNRQREAEEDLFSKFMNEEENKSSKERAKSTKWNFTTTFKEFADKVKSIIDSLKFTGKNGEQSVDDCDKAVNKLKDLFMSALTSLDEILGCTALKNEICKIMYDTVGNTRSRNGFMKMAVRCEEAVLRHIAVLKIVDPDDKLGTIIKLKTLVGYTDEDGKFINYTNEDGSNMYTTQTIWMAFAKGITWICKKGAKLLKKLGDANAEKNVFGAVGASIAEIFGKVGNVVKNTAKLVGKASLFILTYAVAGVLTVAHLVIAVFQYFAKKLKNWNTKKFEIIDSDEEFEDDVILE